LRDGRIDEAIPNLKSLLNDPDYACRAAFYLFAFDGAKDEYIRIIRSETCKHKTPGEAKLLEKLLTTEEKLLTTEEKLLQLKSEYNKQQSRVSDLRKETQNLEKELSRLRFELQKTEEIRRETEKWRIQ
jgi:septal ring factor EnvC (AmiA/AmiB activator)